MEFDKEWIMEFTNSAKIYQEAQRLDHEDCVSSIDIDYTSDHDLIFIHAIVKEQKKYFDVNISIEKETGNVRGHLCDCSEHQQYMCCSHCACVLFKFMRLYNKKQEELFAKNPEKYFSSAISILNEYEEMNIFSSLASSIQKRLHLLPTIENQNGTLTLFFQIQTFAPKRQYVIKDLSGFLYDIRHHVKKGYGSLEPFLHHLQSFDEESRWFIHFLFDHADAQYNQYTYIQSKYFTFTQRSLDDFFDHLNNTYINYKEQKDTSTVFFKQENPEIRLNVHSIEDHFFQFQLEPFQYELFEGKEHYYMLFDQILYQCDETFSKNVYILLKGFKNQEYITLPLNLMKSFYANVIMNVKDHVTLCGADIMPYAPQPLETKVYIDMMQNKNLSFRMIYTYGKDEYNAFTTDLIDNNRNINEEIRIRRMVAQYVSHIDTEHGVAYLRNSNEAIYTFLTQGLDELKNVCEVYISENLKKVKVHNRVKIKLGISIEHDLLNLTIDSNEINKEELVEILKAYRVNRKFYRMKNGSFINLESSGLGELSSLLESMHINEKQIKNNEIKVDTYHALLIDQCLSDTQFEVERDIHYKQLIRDIHSVKDMDHPIPKSLRPLLRNYQKVGFRWLKTMSEYGFSGILADDMGIGKTIQVLTLLLDQKLNKPCTSLIITPSSLIWNWENEIKKFTPELSAVVIHGNSAKRLHLIQSCMNYDIVITSYDYLKRDVEAYKNFKFEYQIIDEAQYIKNTTTRNAISVKQIHAMHRFALTGTPIENRLIELWSIFDFLMPNYLYSYSEFKQYYEIPILKEKDTYALNRLKKMVEPFVLRRVKKDVLKELPEKVEHTIYVELDEENRKLYDTNVEILKQQLREKNTTEAYKSQILILSMLTKLRQLCCDPHLIYENFMGTSQKMEACMELVENYRAAHKKILLFSQFTSLLSLVEIELQKRNIPYYILKGSTPKLLRQQYVHNFQHDDTPIFLISLKAGGTGLNLTSAEVVIHFDPWWNLSAQNQASDRAYRIGQHNNVQIIKLIAKNTVEEKIQNLQLEKQELADSIIQLNEGVITKMSKEDLLHLFD